MSTTKLFGKLQPIVARKPGFPPWSPTWPMSFRQQLNVIEGEWQSTALLCRFLSRASLLEMRSVLSREGE